MTWQSVPWFVAGGTHPPEIARLLAYAATGGGDGGVVQSSDLKVSPLSTPGAGVRVGSGAGTIPNRKPGAGAQSYVARNPSDDVVAIDATGSGSGRVDLIIARIEDPQYPGAAVPSDPTVGPYIFTRVIKDVSPSVTRVQQITGHENDSAITLARVTLPASTSSVLAAHITDLRNVSQPKQRREVRTYSIGAAPAETQTATDAAGQVWPSSAAWNVNVPTWATRARVIGSWNGIKVPDGNATGMVSVRLGDPTGSPTTQETTYDTPSNGGTTRGTLVVADDILIPASVRGTVVRAQMRARKTGGNNSARIIADSGSNVYVDIEFIEDVE